MTKVSHLSARNTCRAASMLRGRTASTRNPASMQVRHEVTSTRTIPAIPMHHRTQSLDPLPMVESPLPRRHPPRNVHERRGKMGRAGAQLLLRCLWPLPSRLAARGGLMNLSVQIIRRQLLPVRRARTPRNSLHLSSAAMRRGQKLPQRSLPQRCPSTSKAGKPPTSDRASCTTQPVTS